MELLAESFAGEEEHFAFDRTGRYILEEWKQKWNENQTKFKSDKALKGNYNKKKRGKIEKQREKKRKKERQGEKKKKKRQKKKKKN